jgi:hypothetical protein
MDGLTGTGSFASTLSGLVGVTTYYVRAYAINAAGTSYGSNESFTTLASAPIVTTTAVTAISGSTANTGGNVTADGGDPITERGIVYSTSSNPTTADTKVIDASASTGSFTSALSALTPLTTYYVRAYATNGIGTSYGSEVSFTTISAQPTVQASSVSFSDITLNGMTVNFTSGDGANSIVVVKASSAVNSNPANTTSYSANAIFGSGAQLGTGNFVVYAASGNSVAITGLTPGTTYHVAVYSFNGSGGNENYLTTTPAIGNQTTLNYNYRSIASGNWSSPLIWEMNDGTAWTASADFPTAVKGTITIQAGHTVALDTSISVDEMTIAATAQVARVEVSTNNGLAWQAVYTQAGTATAGETTFQARSISLETFAGKTIQLRFNFSINSGSFFTETSDGYGWYIDDVKIVTNPTNDLSVTSTFWGTAGLPYFQIPDEQVTEIGFAADVFNGGVNTQTNVKLNIDANSGAWTGSSTAAS